MAGIRDYLVWRGDLSFEISPFNEVDSLILTEITYMEYAGAVQSDWNHPVALNQAAETCFCLRPREEDALGMLLPDEIQDLLSEAAHTPRFQNVQVSGYEQLLDEKEEMQFAALTFDLTDSLRYIAFRGTDDSLVGWKEDCNMGFRFPVPSQEKALLYLRQAAMNRLESQLLVGGHSKGGNLAMFAASQIEDEIRSRIRTVYNHDGPGFPTAEIASGIYQKLNGKLETTVPEESIVGQLMESKGSARFVKSDAFGLWQHDGLTWQVKGTSFEVLSEEPSILTLNRKTLHGWLQSMPLPRREEMVENLFAIRRNTSASTLLELFNSPLQTLSAIWESYDKETREVLFASLRLLLKNEHSALKEVIRDETESFQQTIKENIQETLNYLWEKYIETPDSSSASPEEKSK